MANSVKAEGVMIVSHVATVSSEGSVRNEIHGQFGLFYSIWCRRGDVRPVAQAHSCDNLIKAPAAKDSSYRRPDYTACQFLTSNNS